MLDIRETLLAFKKLNTLIVGDVMLDRYLSGNVDRISPEAPVPIVTLAKTDYRLGGAANVALNIKTLGAKPILCSYIGKDDAGKTLLNLLAERELTTKYLLSSTHRKTTTKTRILAQNQQILRIDEEDTFDLLVTEQKTYLSTIKTIIEQNEIDVILFQDYNKGVLSASTIREILLEALKRDIPTIVDPKNDNFFAYQRVTLFKPNLKEINTNLPFQSKTNLEDLKRATDYLKQKINNLYTLITLSDKGIFFSDKDQQAILPTTPRNIADVCGAGDSVVSIAALALGLKLPLADIALLANLAGGQVCEKVGVVPVDAKQLTIDYLNLLA